MGATGKRLPGLVRRGKTEALAYSNGALVGAVVRTDDGDAMEKT